MLKEESKVKKEWAYEEVVEKFKEWYGIDVGEAYYRDALERLVEEGFLKKYDDKFILT